MKSRVFKVIIILALILAMTMSNFLIVGNSIISYAIDNLSTNNSKVEFNAYFKNEKGENVSNIGVNTDNLVADLYIYLNIKQEGYMNSQIKIENSNFKLKNSESQYVNKIEGDTITLNQINAGAGIEIPIKVEFMREEQMDINMLNKETTVSLNGIYKDQKEKDINIKSTRNVVLELVKQSAEVEDKLEVVTNKVLKVSGQEKRVVQLSFSTQLKDSKYPIKQIDIEIDKPEIGGKLPEVSKIDNLSNMTKSEISEQDGKSIITLKNEAENSMIQWKSQSKENIIVTYMYDADINVENTEILARAKTMFYDNTEMESTSSIKLTAETEANSVVTGSIYNAETSIYKGALYQGKSRDIITKSEIDINVANVVDYLNIAEKNMIVKDDTQSYNAAIIYKRTVFNKENLFKILGNDGKLTVIDQNATEIFVIDSSIQADSEGNIVIDYAAIKPKQIVFKITTPVNTGKIEITNYKQINQESSKIAKEDRKIVSELYASSNLTESKAVGLASIETSLEESKTEARLELNKTELSTVIKNSIEMRAILKSNSEANDLYENPVIRIALPDGITSINIEDIKIMYDEELKIKDYSLNGNILTITIEGKQTKYAEGAVEGTYIVINATIEFDKRTVSADDTFSMTYENKNANMYEGQANIGNTSANIKVVAPTDVTVINSIDELAVEEMGQDIQKEVIIPVNTAKKEIKPEIEIINNKENSIKDVKILGTFPTKNDSTNNMDTRITEGINVQGAKVYYTNNENATDDIQNKENKWEETINDTTKVRKYLIVLDSIEAKSNMVASYKAEIPENLEYNKNAEEGYQVTYTDGVTNTNSTINAVNEKMTTGRGPVLETSIEVSLGDNKLQENDKIHSGEIIKYTVKVKNSGQEDAQNVKIDVNIPEELIYVLEKTSDLNNPFEEKEEKSIIAGEGELGDVGNIGTVAIGEEKVCEYQFKVKQEVSSNTSLKVEFITKYKDIEDKQVIDKQVESLDFGARIYYLDTKDVYEESSIIYNVVVENYSNNILKNVVVNLNPAEGIELQSADLSRLLKDTNSDEFEKELELNNGKISIGDITSGETKYISITAKVREIKENNSILSLGAVINANNKTLKTNTINCIGHKFNVIAEISEEKAGGYITAEDTLNYSILLKNLGNTDATIKLVDVIPEQLNVKEVLVDGKSIQDIPDEDFGNNQDNEENVQVDMQDIEEKVIPEDSTDTEEEVKNDGLANDIERTIEIPANKDVTVNIITSVDGQDGEFDEEVKITNKAQVLSSTDQILSETGDVFHILRNMILDENNNMEEPSDEDDFNDDDKDQPSDSNTGSEQENPDENDNGNEQDDPNRNDSGNEQEKPDGSDDGHEQEKPDDNNDDRNNQDDSDNNENNSQKPGNQTSEKYIISGIVWVDNDRDGQLTSQDERISGKKVKLVDTATGKVIKEYTTSENGEYMFTDTTKGEYMVVCEYEPSQYTLVAYEQEGVDSSRGSSVISKKMTLDNEEKIYAATDIVKVEDKSIPYKNIGFVKAEKFDLKLEKFVSKMSIQNSAGTIVKEYDNSTLAKIELDSKVVNGTTVIVEYKIRVSNVGEVEGYVKNIVDYIPNDLKFNSELNKDWYQSGSNLYNSSLANSKIGVGESKEVTLILVKSMTENNLGRVNNTAEIAEAYNELGVDDINSTPLNRVQNENDMGSADIIISLRTGATTMYITIITIIVLMALSTVIIPIIKRRKKTVYSNLDKM